ncbi:MAG: hypothetical protein FWE97_00675 [Dehalococcoidia bacterium]|nr:hypothetical protein [Dehalococcoidia bacterium]
MGKKKQARKKKPAGKNQWGKWLKILLAIVLVLVIAIAFVLAFRDNHSGSCDESCNQHPVSGECHCHGHCDNADCDCHGAH